MYNPFDFLQAPITMVLDLKVQDLFVLHLLAIFGSLIWLARREAEIKRAQRREEEKAARWLLHLADFCQEWNEAFNYVRGWVPGEIVVMARRHSWDLGYMILLHRRSRREGYSDMKMFFREIIALYRVYYENNMTPYPKEHCPWHRQPTPDFPFVEKFQ